jgi:hypothetical protein
MENDLDRLADASVTLEGGRNLGLSTPEPYPCASPGSYLSGELFPYIAGAVVPGFGEAEEVETAAELEEAAAELAASTGRTEASNLTEQLAMESAQADPESGRLLPITMSDARWPASEGWVKMGQNINGVEIHYVYNIATGAVADFKFVP